MPEFTKLRARQHSRRRLATIEASLVRMAGHWGDLDNGVIYEIDQLVDVIDELRSTMDEACEEEEQP